MSEEISWDRTVLAPELSLERVDVAEKCCSASDGWPFLFGMHCPPPSFAYFPAQRQDGIWIACLHEWVDLNLLLASVSSLSTHGVFGSMKRPSPSAVRAQGKQRKRCSLGPSLSLHYPTLSATAPVHLPMASLCRRSKLPLGMCFNLYERLKFEMLNCRQFVFWGGQRNFRPRIAIATTDHMQQQKAVTSEVFVLSQVQYK